MHEYPITQRIIEIAAESAELRRVTSITVVAGNDCGYLPESILLYFDLLSAGTVCEGAVLHFERVESQLECRDCGLQFARVPFSFACPNCGGDGAPTQVGREFYVKSIEIEEVNK